MQPVIRADGVVWCLLPVVRQGVCGRAAFACQGFLPFAKHLGAQKEGTEGRKEREDRKGTKGNVGRKER